MFGKSKYRILTAKSKLRIRSCVDSLDKTANCTRRCIETDLELDNLLIMEVRVNSMMASPKLAEKIRILSSASVRGGQNYTARQII